MKIRMMLILAASLLLAACEKDTGAGFTGIGQSSLTPYSFGFDGLGPAAVAQ